MRVFVAVKAHLFASTEWGRGGGRIRAQIPIILIPRLNVS